MYINGMAAEATYPDCYLRADIKSVSDEDFRAILGREIPDGSWGGEITENDALCQLYYAKSRLWRLIYKLLTSIKNKSEAKGKPDINILFIYNMPIRAIAKMSGGLVTRAMTEDLLLMINGHPWRGFGRLVRNFFRGRSASSKFKKQLRHAEKAARG